MCDEDPNSNLFDQLGEFFKFYNKQFIPAHSLLVSKIDTMPQDIKGQVLQIFKYLSNVFDEDVVSQEAKGQHIFHAERALNDITVVCYKYVLGSIIGETSQFSAKIDKIGKAKLQYCIDTDLDTYNKTYKLFDRHRKQAVEIEECTTESSNVNTIKIIKTYGDAIKIGSELTNYMNFDKLESLEIAGSQTTEIVNNQREMIDHLKQLTSKKQQIFYIIVGVVLTTILAAVIDETAVINAISDITTNWTP